MQQLEFTTSAANSQPQQISTNVTVKTHANASVKSDISSPKAPTPGTPGHTQKANIGLDVGTLVECVKQVSYQNSWSWLILILTGYCVYINNCSIEMGVSLKIVNDYCWYKPNNAKMLGP